jgi:uncharacterized membrane protein
VRVQRVEETGAFPLEVEADGDTARLTDARLDPGALCIGRTVTARYEVSFEGEAEDGEVRFQAEVFDARARLLQRASGTSQVVDGAERAEEEAPAERAEPSPSPSKTTPADEDASRDAEVDQQDAGEEPAAAPAETPIAAVPAGNGGSTSLLGVGLVIGALLIFMGVGLLLRLRLRNRNQDDLPAMTRTFNPAP